MINRNVGKVVGWRSRCPILCRTGTFPFAIAQRFRSTLLVSIHLVPSLISVLVRGPLYLGRHRKLGWPTDIRIVQELAMVGSNIVSIVEQLRRCAIDLLVFR